MKLVELYQNFLDPTLIRQIKEYADQEVKNFKWRSSYTWTQDVQRFTTPVLALELTPFHQSIQNQYRKLNKKFKNMEIFVPLFYAWPQGSYIAWHTDQEFEFTSSIYLNEEWDINYGGIFLYYDKKKITGHAPRYNQCLLSTEGVIHSVTRTTPDAPVRQSIQIFSQKKKTTSFHADGGRKQKKK